MNVIIPMTTVCSCCKCHISIEMFRKEYNGFYRTCIKCREKRKVDRKYQREKKVFLPKDIINIIAKYAMEYTEFNKWLSISVGRWSILTKYHPAIFIIYKHMMIINNARQAGWRSWKYDKYELFSIWDTPRMPIPNDIYKFIENLSNDEYVYLKDHSKIFKTNKEKLIKLLLKYI